MGRRRVAPPTHPPTQPPIHPPTHPPSPHPGLRAAKEAPEYAADEAEDAPAEVARADGLLAARLALARRDPLRAVGAEAAARAAATKVGAA